MNRSINGSTGSSVSDAFGGFLQGIGGLIVGAVWSFCVRVVSNALLTPGGSARQQMLTKTVAVVVVPAVAIPLAIMLWRKGAKNAAVGLLLGSAYGASLIVALLNRLVPQAIVFKW
jgi:hypothetical protein